jgi:uncharacterized Zn finger protein (UPF0148 family)
MKRANNQAVLKSNTRRSRLVRNNTRRPVRETQDSEDELNEKENVRPNDIILVKPTKNSKGLSDTMHNQELEMTCIICCDNIEQRASIDSCAHTFCLSCIKVWSEKATTCPVCRTRFKTIKSEGKSRPIIVQQRDYQHEEEEIYAVVGRLIDELDEEEDDSSDIDENGNLIGFIDYTEPTVNHRHFRSVFECDDDEYQPSQSTQPESEDEEELISTQDHSVISVYSSPRKRKSPAHKKRRILLFGKDEDGYASDKTEILDQEEIYQNVVRNLLFDS